jgi:hypothetical protein
MFYTIIGICGGLLILFGFYRTSVGKWSGKSLWYELDNFFGAGLLTIYQWHFRVYISVVLNIIWAVVAFRGLESFDERKLNGKRKR